MNDPNNNEHVIVEVYSNKIILTAISKYKYNKDGHPFEPLTPEEFPVVYDQKSYPLINPTTGNIEFSMAIFSSILQTYLIDSPNAQTADFHLIISETFQGDSSFFNHTLSDGATREEKLEKSYESIVALIEMKLSTSQYANQSIEIKKYAVNENSPDGHLRGIFCFMSSELKKEYEKIFTSLNLFLDEITFDTVCLKKYMEIVQKKLCTGNDEVDAENKKNKTLISIIHMGDNGCIFAGIHGNTFMTFPLKYGKSLYLTQGGLQFDTDFIDFIKTYSDCASNQFEKMICILSGEAKESPEFLSALEMYATGDSNVTIIGGFPVRMSEVGLKNMIEKKTAISQSSNEIIYGVWRNIKNRSVDSIVTYKKPVQNKFNIFNWFKLLFN